MQNSVHFEAFVSMANVNFRAVWSHWSLRQKISH